MDGQLTIAIEDPRSPDGRAIVKRFFTDIVGRYWSRAATLAEVEQAMLDEPSDDLRDEVGFFLVIRDGARVVGCGGVRFIEPGVGEVTRVFVDDELRGRGAGRALINELETISTRRGVRTLRLTVRSDLTDADHHLAKTLSAAKG